MNILMNIDSSAVDWARVQFAVTAIYHWLFVPLTLGLALIMGIMETIYYRTKSVDWLVTAKFWQRLFGINFAIGVATGIVLEFEFGTNWSNYSWFVGDIFGAPLAIEGIVAFFMESTFVAVMFFGWKKVSRGFHLASTWLTGIGATFSAWWILVANSWMQYPVGCEFNPDTMRNEMTSFLDVALSPFAVNKFCHTVSSAWIVGALFVVGVSCWYLLRRRHVALALRSIKVAGIVGLVAILLTLQTGDGSAYMVAKTQPMKLAAMEALYEGGTDQSLTVIAAVNPFEQPEWQKGGEPPLHIAAPYALSFLATRDIHGFVPGVKDIVDGGYTQPDGTTALSLKDKQEIGKRAIENLQTYRNIAASKTLTSDDKRQLEALATSLKADMPYFGYGFIKDAGQLVPYIPVCFYAFRVMVGLGTLFLAFFALVLLVVYRYDIQKMRWLQMLAVAMIPLAWICSEAGWIVAEMGRQPWAIQDMMPTWTAVSDVHAGGVLTTLVLFIIIFSALLVAEISIMCRQIARGPEE